MNLFDRVLYRAGEVAGYLAGVGLVGDAIYKASNGEFQLAAAEAIVGIYAGFCGHTSGQRRKAIQDF